MDPYLESPGLWKGVHDSLVYRMLEDLQPQLQPRYLAVLEGRLLLQPLDQLAVPGSFRAGWSDVSVKDTPAAPRPASISVLPTAAAPEIAVPEWVDEPDLRIWHSYLEIRDAENHSVVTVIEVLSPWNKSPGQGQEEYRAKQRVVLLSDANLVEIDLLRGGGHTVAVPPSKTPPSPYRICIHRIARPAGFELVRFGIRDPLPRVGIPLRPTDTDVALNLPEVFQRVYDTGVFDRLAHYDSPAEPPLADDDAAWADELLRARGYR